MKKIVICPNHKECRGCKDTAKKYRHDIKHIERETCHYWCLFNNDECISLEDADEKEKAR